MTTIVRRLVSKKKKRLEDQDEGFSLDLAYITPSIIAMGFPSTSLEALYRNPYGKVLDYLDTKHQDKYMVYNLCVEDDKQYPSSKFYGRVQNYQFPDHTPPAFPLLVRMTENMAEWAQHPENVLAIHCKAGKGRTGLAVVCYLLHSGICQSIREALVYYARQRTLDLKGLRIPSQRRFAAYFSRYMHTTSPHCERLKLNALPFQSDNEDEQDFDMVMDRNLVLDLTSLEENQRVSDKTKKVLECRWESRIAQPFTSPHFSLPYSIVDVNIRGTPNLSNAKLYYVLNELVIADVVVDEDVLHQSKPHKVFSTRNMAQERNEDNIFALGACNMKLKGSYQLRISARKTMKNVKLCSVYFDTAFLHNAINPVRSEIVKHVFTKEEIDGAFKDTDHEHFSSDFALEVTFRAHPELRDQELEQEFFDQDDESDGEDLHEESTNTLEKSIDDNVEDESDAELELPLSQFALEAHNDIATDTESECEEKEEENEDIVMNMKTNMLTKKMQDVEDAKTAQEEMKFFKVASDSMLSPQQQRNLHKSVLNTRAAVSEYIYGSETESEAELNDESDFF
ncbi:hypothetical protein PCE1_004019 [Barthelona sp. PCE]